MGIAQIRSGGNTRSRLNWLYGLFGLLCISNAVTLTALLMAPDIAALFVDKTDLRSAYENRINQLRVEVDRLHSRQFAQAGNVNLQLQELAQQQTVLEEQQQYVKALAQKASELGLTASLDDPSPLPVAAIAAPTPDNVADTTANVQRMLEETRQALTSISTAANDRTDTILAELAGIGIRPALPDGGGMGGPYEPPIEGAADAESADDANAVYNALVRLKAARQATSTAPVHEPIAGLPPISSSFGNRRDPFTGRMAFHAGLDFPASTGTSVFSAADGVVTFVGEKAGYGNLVEITHPSGYVTRYGHLSAFLVKAGVSVKAGTPIALVGSTGRSTGPHLHFEVRRADSPLNPIAFLNVGKRLAALLKAS